jgi:hypothetical protein
MSKERMVNTKFWDDDYIIALDPTEKLLFLYFLTNPLTNIAGVYEISLRRIAFDTGIDKDAVTKIIDRFCQADKISYCDGFAIVHNFIKHQNFSEKSKIKDGINAILAGLPDKIKNEINKIYIRYGSPSNYLNLNLNSNLNLNKSNAPVGYSDEFKNFWNEYPRKIDKGKAFKQWIKRVKDGAKVEDLILAAKNYASYCKSAKKQMEYVKHPATFIGPDKSFEDYIHQSNQADSTQSTIERMRQIQPGG